jgi:ABC-type multidrug transport system ATPase subunit
MPKLLLLDEATSGLDMISRRKFLQHIKKLTNTLGMTIVMTT